jgi:hypothetical protein
VGLLDCERSLGPLEETCDPIFLFKSNATSAKSIRLPTRLPMPSSRPRFVRPDFGLLVKFYVEHGTDIGQFVNEKGQAILAFRTPR